MTPRAILPLFAVAACGAATIDVNDLRVGLGWYAPVDQAWSESYAAGPWSVLPSGSGSGGDWGAEVFTGFEIMYTRGHLPRGGGFIWAVGMHSGWEWHHAPVLGTYETVATSTWGLTGRAGYGLPIGPRVHLEIMPEFQAGWMWTDVHDTDGWVVERTTGDGRFVAGGIHVGGYVTVDRNLVLGGSFGWRRCNGHYDAGFASTGGYVDGRLMWTEVGAQFEIGVRF